MNIQEAQANLNRAAMEWYHNDDANKVRTLQVLLADACAHFNNSAVSLGADITASEDSDFSRVLTLFYAEEQERIALRIANTLGQRYGWDNEEKDIVCIEVLGIMTQEEKG